MQDWFAPAQFDDLTRVEKLAAPSYEAMNAGVSFGIGGIALPAEDEVRSVTTRYEREVIDGDVTVGLSRRRSRRRWRLPRSGTSSRAVAGSWPRRVLRDHGRHVGHRRPADRACDWDRRHLPRDARRAAGAAAREREGGAAVRDAGELDLPRGPFDDPIDVDPTHGGRP